MIARLIQLAGLALAALGAWLTLPFLVSAWIELDPLVGWRPTLDVIPNFLAYVLFFAAITPGVLLFYFGSSRVHQSSRGPRPK